MFGDWVEVKAKVCFSKAWWWGCGDLVTIWGWKARQIAVRGG